MADRRHPLQRYVDDLRWQDASGFTDFQSDVWDELRAAIPEYDARGWLIARAIFEAGTKSGYRDCMERWKWMPRVYLRRVRNFVLRLVGQAE